MWSLDYLNSDRTILNGFKFINIKTNKIFRRYETDIY